MTLANKFSGDYADDWMETTKASRGKVYPKKLIQVRGRCSFWFFKHQSQSKAPLSEMGSGNSWYHNVIIEFVEDHLRIR